MNKLSITILALGLALAASCGPTTSGDQKDAGPGGDAINSHLREDGPQTDAQVDAGQSDASPPAPKIVYAHTATTLYQGDPTVSPLVLQVVGDFDCVGGSGQDAGMTDIAVDVDGNLFGVSNTAFYSLTISGSTVHCGTPHTLPTTANFYGLTIAPAGVLAAGETLVAANAAGELYYIDSQGQTTEVGTFGVVPSTDGQGHSYASANVGKAWELSGDIVFLANGGNWVGFATVTDCPTPPSKSGCNQTDTLVEIDMTKLALGNTASVTKGVKGQVVKSATCTDPNNPDGYGSMYGITAWENKVYGFSKAGNLVEISNADGSACLVQNYSSYAFWGAGITTSAPFVID